MDSHSVLLHCFAGDTQLQKSAPPQQVDELIQSMQQRVHDVKLWMTHNKLKLNYDKTEALIIPASRISNSTPLPDSLTVRNLTVHFSQSARYLGVTFDMHLTMTAHVVNLIRSANFELCCINSIRHYLSVQVTLSLFWLLFFHDWTIAVPSFLDDPSTFKTDFKRFRTMQPASSWKLLRQTTHLIFALCTGFHSMLESNTNFVLFVLVLSLLLVLSIFLIYSWFTHPLGNSNLPQTSIYCAFHLSTLSHTVNTLSLTPLQHSGTHFQKTSDFLSQFLPLDQHSRLTFFQHKDIVLINWLIDWVSECVHVSE